MEYDDGIVKSYSLQKLNFVNVKRHTAILNDYYNSVFKIARPRQPPGQFNRPENIRLRTPWKFEISLFFEYKYDSDVHNIYIYIYIHIY